MASDPERLARFEQEARAVAALNHPHIVTLDSVEEADGINFLTMELVEGESLADASPSGASARSDLESAPRWPRRSRPRTTRASSIAT